jgi:hypothetical protein
MSHMPLLFFFCFWQQAGNACMGMLPMANLDMIIVGGTKVQTYSTVLGFDDAINVQTYISYL